MSILGLLAGSGSVFVPPPSGPGPGLSSAVSLTFDGNSLTAGAGTPQPLIHYVIEYLGEDLNGARYLKGGNYQTAGISGQDWTGMTANHGDADFFFDPTRTNCLVVSEDTNAIHQGAGRTAAQTIADAKAYFAAMWAVHPEWKILMWGNIPRTSDPSKNAALIEVNDYWRENWAAEGLAGWVDVRTGIPQYDHDGSSNALFTAYAGSWAETSAPYVHPNEGSYENNTGTRAIARRLGDALQSLSWSS